MRPRRALRIVPALGCSVVMSACQSGASGFSSRGDTESTSGGTTIGATSATTGTSGEGPIVLECEPGEVRCMGQGFLETCAPTGLLWIADPCPHNTACVSCDPDDEACTAADRCVGPCDGDLLMPSSAGCSFIANRQIHQNEAIEDSVIIANPNKNLTARVSFWATPPGKREETLVEALELAPGKDHVFSMASAFVLGETSLFRTGGTFRVESDAPIVAYQHSPYANYIGNDSSLLLPENALGKTYVVASYAPHEENDKGKPSFFEIVAIEDYTDVRWTPPVPTAGDGLPIPAVGAGGTGEQAMSRFDTMRIVASEASRDDFPSDLQDVSGTVIEASKPIWVVGGSRCSRVPVRAFPVQGYCDPLQEVLIPLELWGKEYIAPHPPIRGAEQHFWRIYAGGREGVTLTSDPPVFTSDNCPPPNTFVDGSCTLPARGAWIEVAVANGTSFHVSGDKPFLPVGYLQSRRQTSPVAEPEETSTLWGDPAMYQLVPIAQFIERYVIQTAVGYPHHYAQLIRPVGGPNVVVDTDVVGSWAWVPVGGGTYEVATVEILEGTHTIHSSAPFGVLQVGFTETGFEHHEGCVNPAGPECAACPDNPTEEACESAVYDDHYYCCSWVDDACIAASLCSSSYAYPGGMRGVPIYIP